MEQEREKKSARRRSRRGKSVALAPRERRRLVQLCVCLALFLGVFLGRGIFPERMETVRRSILTRIGTDTDFRAVFADVGRALEDRTAVGDTLTGLWTQLFVKDEPEVPEPSAVPEPDAGPGQEEPPEPAAPQPEAPALPAPEPEPEPVYTGPPMPDNATLERRDLGLDTTVSPVLAAVSSGFGWREDPLGEGEKFHAGADLAANYGEPIGAFAAGTVDYIGESPAYGQYIQLKHAGGVTSFYAHCSKLCAQPGQQVAPGEKVAEVGASGNVTGAHLHLEIKQDGVLLDPLNYVDTLEG